MPTERPIPNLRQLAPQIVPTRRRDDALEAVIGWLEVLADRARRSWMHRDARVPLGRVRR